MRQSAFGGIVRLVTPKKLFQYPEERPGFQLPEAWVKLMKNEEPVLPASSSQSQTVEDEVKEAQNRVEDQQSGRQPVGIPKLALQRSRSRGGTIASAADRIEANKRHEPENTKSIPIVSQKTNDSVILVGWYCSDDAENPQNWSNLRRAMVTTIICLYTFVVFVSSAIYVASEDGVAEEFGVGKTTAALGFSLFVLGYGTGPLLFSPLSEIPAIGRNPVYIITMLLYTLIAVPTALVQNDRGLMMLRFLGGFCGSPCLSSGGASVGDMYSLLSLPYALLIWVLATFCGTALGPLLSGYSVPAMGWRWSLLEIIWAASPVFLLMFFCLPETSAAKILLQRAQRLRKLTGSPRFMSQSEIEKRNSRTSAVLLDALIKPLEITLKDPAILFVQIYTAIICGIYYSFFEVFAIVYPFSYGMTAGQVGLVFLCVLMACMISIATYALYIYWYLNPRIRTRGWPEQETRLVPALVAAAGPPAGLFIFAWTASPRYPWWVPTVGMMLYGATVLVIQQSIFVYIPASYPRYAASLFAGNGFFRAAFACGSILFAGPLYGNLGVARGTSLLAGLSTIGIIGILVLYMYGARLRAMSTFAVSPAERWTAKD